MKEKVLQAFREHLGGEPEFIVRAPGRVNLIGEHTDYNGGFVMPLAVERATWIALRRRDGDRARLFSLDFGSWAEAGADETPLRGGEHSWDRYFAGVAGEFAKNFPFQAWEGVSVSDLPLGAGLSSSASFELALARAFAAVAGVGWDPAQMALLCHRVESEWVGVNCGTMDQLAVALGRRRHALLIDCRSLEVRPIPLPKGLAIVILDTTKARTLAGSAYNVRRQQCEEAAGRLGAASLRDVPLDIFRKAASSLDPILAKRARHVITENTRTLEAAAAMAKNDAVSLGRLMNLSHESLRHDYEVSCEELDAIVEAARAQKSCLGARMTGAGFGGCAVALVAEKQVDGFIKAVDERYRQTTGLTAKQYATAAFDGASAMDLSGAGQRAEV